ncbi:MAG: XRE family transcriptional regulator [Fimbriimonadales bacterium]|nr:MAG: XRE family transcriptional regulator [Fimbriimonadales bacterium]
MAEELKNEYTPDHAAHPSETLREVLAALQMTQADLARRMGRSTKHVNEIVHGQSDLTPQIASELEFVLRVPAGFWLRLQANYLEVRERNLSHFGSPEYEEWLKRFPYTEMVRLGWVKPHADRGSRVRELLQFFGVASLEAWRASYAMSNTQYRKSAHTRHHHERVAAWLRQGEIQAAEIRCSPYDERLFKEALREARSLTAEPTIRSIESKVRELCAPAGVAVVVVPPLRGTGVFGATRWLTKTKALIQLSTLYKRNDTLWFTFFHEAAHVLLHRKRQTYVDFKEDLGSPDEQVEQEANRFAENALVERNAYEQFVRQADFTEHTIRSFAQQVGVAPGIVVGRLQHDGYVTRDRFTNLLQRYDG